MGTPWADRVFVPLDVPRVHSLRYLWLAVLAAGGFLLTAVGSAAERPSGAEEEVFELLNGLPDAISPVLVTAMQLGSLAAIFVVGGLLFLAHRVRLGGYAMMAGLAAWVAAKIVKRFVERGRPDDYVSDVIIRGAVQAGLGYPSGHATVAAAMATVISPHLRLPGRIVIWTLAALVAVARVYTGAHLPLDTLGGFLLGWSIGALINLAAGTPETSREQAGRRAD